MKRLNLLAILLSPFWLVGCSDNGQEPDTSKDKNVVIVIETSMGTIKAKLFAEKAPITVKNVLEYVDKRFYDDTTFHRVIPGFMVQGGGFEVGAEREKKTNAPIRNESYNRLLNKRGRLAMARTGVPDRATSQFFINVADNAPLDRVNTRDGVGYAVFGEVIEGMDVADAIVDVHRDEQDKPLKDVIIKSIRRAQ